MEAEEPVTANGNAVETLLEVSANETDGPLDDGAEDRPAIPISALRHYRFCPRRCALQYVEEISVDNAYTLEGDALHEHVDDPGAEERAGLRVERALPLFSD